MCDQNKLDGILHRIAQQAQSVFGNRLEQVILYGSYARGDFDVESDIDIMILADVDRDSLHQFKPSFRQLTSDLGMENVSDCHLLPPSGGSVFFVYAEQFLIIRFANGRHHSTKDNR